MNNIFISYSHKDEPLKEELQTMLKALVGDIEIAAFDDRKIQYGKDWAQEIDIAIEECNIAILLVSADFLNSEFINSVELSKLIERERDDGITIVPVILRPCVWKFRDTISSRNVFPKDGKPIVSFETHNGSREQQWQNLAEFVIEIPKKTENPKQDVVQHELHSVDVKKGPACVLFCEVTFSSKDQTQPLSFNEAAYKRFISYISKIVSTIPGAQFIKSADAYSITIFPDAISAVTAALKIQSGLHNVSQKLSDKYSVASRIGLDFGQVSKLELEEVSGKCVLTAFELMQIANKEQILTSGNVFELAQRGNFLVPSEFVRWAQHGEYVFSSSGLSEIVEITDARIKKPELPKKLKDQSFSEATKLNIPSFELLNRTSSYGATIVYRALQTDTNKIVGIKILSSELSESEYWKSDFLNRFKAIKNLSHDGIVKIIEIRDDNQLPYVVMEWIDGDTLEIASKNMTLMEKLNVVIGLCSALETAHKHDLPHLDLAPQNIVIRKRDNAPILIDFGFGKTAIIDQSNTSSSAINLLGGTPNYVAPEQIDDDEKISINADIYSLGIILYELIVGHLPFEYDAVQQLHNAHLHLDPPLPVLENPEIPEQLQRICLKAIEKKITDRYLSIQDFRLDLERFQKGEKIAIRPRVYNNLIETRANNHLTAIRQWHNSNLITDNEHIALERTYAPLVRSGIAAISESRLIHLPTIFMYLFGIFYVIGTTILISGTEYSHAILKFPVIRTLLGLMPPVLFGLVWWHFWKKGWYRDAFLLSILAIISMPFAFVHSIYEMTTVAFDIHQPLPSYKAALFGEENEYKYLNWQLITGTTITLILAYFISRKSLTVTTATLSAILICIVYFTSLDIFGLSWLMDNLATFGLLLLPLTAILLFLGYRTKYILGQSRQSAPFFTASLLSLVLSSQLIALNLVNEVYLEPQISEINTVISDGDKKIYALEDKTDDEKDIMSQEFSEPFYMKIDKLNDTKASISGLSVSLISIFYLSLGLWLQKTAPIEAKQAYQFLYYLFAISLVGGILTADFFWPSFWNGHPVNLVGQDVRLLAIVSLVFSIITVLLSVKVQSNGALVLGLFSCSVSVSWIQFSYFTGTGNDNWSITVMLFGLVALLIFVYKKIKSDLGEDIDDVAEKLLKG